MAIGWVFGMLKCWFDGCFSTENQLVADFRGIFLHWIPIGCWFEGCFVCWMPIGWAFGLLNADLRNVLSTECQMVADLSFFLFFCSGCQLVADLGSLFLPCSQIGCWFEGFSVLDAGWLNVWHAKCWFEDCFFSYLFLAFLPFIGIGHCRQEAKMGLEKVGRSTMVLQYVGTLPTRLLAPRIWGIFCPLNVNWSLIWEVFFALDADWLSVWGVLNADWLSVWST